MDRWWVGAASGAWNNNANWSSTADGLTVPASFPVSGDDVFFTAVGDARPLVLTATADCASLSVVAGYTKKLDLAGWDLVIDDGSNVTLNGAGEFDLGTGTIWISNGAWDVVGQGAWDEATSRVRFDGICTINAGAGQAFNNLRIDSGTTTVITTNPQVNETITLNGVLSISAGRTLVHTGALVVNAAPGQLTGAGTLQMFTGAGDGVTVFNATGVIDIANFDLRAPNPAAVLRPGFYDTIFRVQNPGGGAAVLTLDVAGNYTFSSLELENTGAGSLRLANDTNGPRSITVLGAFTIDRDAGTIEVDNAGVTTVWIFLGDIIDQAAAGFTWTAGNGVIVFAGAAAQNVNFPGASTLEQINVLKTNVGDVVTLRNNFTCASWNTQQGTVAPDSRTIIVTGNMFVDGHGRFGDMSDCEFTIGGNLHMHHHLMNITFAWNAAFTLDIAGDCELHGVTFAPVGANDMLLEVDGVAMAFDCIVERSNAGGFTQVDASDPSNIDAGNNTNWLFAAAITPNPRKGPGGRFLSHYRRPRPGHHRHRNQPA